jgi:hypothetical protein
MFMVLTWALTITGFVLIFVELKAWSAEQNPHAILGTITTIICFFQPIGAYFRPHPGTSRRPIFNWLHWLGGNVAHIVASMSLLLFLFAPLKFIFFSCNNFLRCQIDQSRTTGFRGLDFGCLCRIPCHYSFNFVGM